MAKFKYQQNLSSADKMRNIPVKEKVPAETPGHSPHQCKCKGGCKDGGKCCGKHHQ